MTITLPQYYFGYWGLFAGGYRGFLTTPNGTVEVFTAKHPLIEGMA